MAGRRVYIEFTASRLDVAVVRGRVIESHRSARVSLPNFAERFAESVRACQERLAGMVRELGAAGLPAVLVHGAPEAACGVFSHPAGMKRKLAENAARLALSEAASYPLDMNPSDLAPLAEDEAGSGADGSAAQAHVLGASDTEDEAEVLAAWLESAGLRVEAMVPLSAVGMAEVVRRSMGGSRGAVRVVVHIGEHETVYAAASRGRLRFVRRVSMGSESFVEALQRDWTMPGTGRVVRFDTGQARAFFGTHGVPRRGETVQVEGEEVPAEAVLPLMQPTVQRFLLETKQSLRFGLTEAERAETTIEAVGPGAGIPNLTRLIAEQVGIKAEGGTAGGGSGTGAGLGMLPLAVERGVPGVNLLPRPLAERARFAAVRRGVWLGAAAAGLLIVVDCALTRVEAQVIRGRIASLEREDASLSRASEATARAAKLRERVLELESRLSRAEGLEPLWGATLMALARATPANVQITDARVTTEGGRARCVLSGRATAGATRDPADAVTGYLRVVAGLPVVKSCHLGQTSRVSGEEGEEQRFEMAVELVSVPHTVWSALAMKGGV